MKIKLNRESRLFEEGSSVATDSGVEIQDGKVLIGGVVVGELSKILKRGYHPVGELVIGEEVYEFELDIEDLYNHLCQKALEMYRKSSEHSELREEVGGWKLVSEARWPSLEEVGELYEVYISSKRVERVVWDGDTLSFLHEGRDISNLVKGFKKARRELKEGAKFYSPKDFLSPLLSYSSEESETFHNYVIRNLLPVRGSIEGFMKEGDITGTVELVLKVKKDDPELEKVDLALANIDREAESLGRVKVQRKDSGVGVLVWKYILDGSEVKSINEASSPQEYITAETLSRVIAADGEGGVLWRVNLAKDNGVTKDVFYVHGLEDYVKDPKNASSWDPQVLGALLAAASAKRGKEKDVFLDFFTDVFQVPNTDGILVYEIGDEVPFAEGYVEIVDFQEPYKVIYREKETGKVYKEDSEMFCSQIVLAKAG